MPAQIKNGIVYQGGSPVIPILKADYKILEEQGAVNPCVIYNITDEEYDTPQVTLTYAEYLALPEETKHDGVVRYITDYPNSNSFIDNNSTAPNRTWGADKLSVINSTLGQIVDSPNWNTLTVDTNEWTNWSWESLAWCKIGKIVYVHGGGTPKNTAATTLINKKIAEGLPKPRQNTGVSCGVNNSASGVANWLVNYSGELIYVGSSVATTSGVYCCFSYVTRE